MNVIADPPKQMVLETVSMCNLKCPSCFVGADMIRRATNPGQKLMPWELFENLANQAEPFIRYTYMYLWGEPLIHPQIGKMIRRISEFSKTSLSTHGMFVTEENAKDLALVDALSVSMDGLDQETYEIYRVGGDFERARNGLGLLAAAKPGEVLWEWVVHAKNEHQIPEARYIAKQLGVKLNLRKPYFVSEQARRELEPKGTQWWRYQEDGSLIANRYDCREFWETIYFLPNGECTTCCYDYDAQWVMGNANEESLMDIWNGEKYQQMRRNHIDKNLNELCKTQCHLWSGK